MNLIVDGLSRLTTPLLPDDYVSLVNPMWHSGLRARIHRVVRETGDAVTLVLRPSRPLPAHRAGQHLQLGIDIAGVRHWRSYSLTSPAGSSHGDLSITVKKTSHGVVSRHLAIKAQRGDLVHLEPPTGDFVLPTYLPDKILFIAAGSGITPIMSMLRTIEASDSRPDVELISCARTPEEVIFGAQLRQMADSESSWLTLIQRHTASEGRLQVGDLDRIVTDWRERTTWVCGPAQLLDEAQAHWREHDLDHLLHVERFQTAVLATGAAGGSVRFCRSDKGVDVDGDTSLLSAGESAGVLMPNGCRMGICFTCVLPLVSGQVRDTRTGEVHGDPGDLIQTCVSAPASTVEIDI